MSTSTKTASMSVPVSENTTVPSGENVQRIDEQDLIKCLFEPEVVSASLKKSMKESTKEIKKRVVVKRSRGIVLGRPKRFCPAPLEPVPDPVDDFPESSDKLVITPNSGRRGWDCSRMFD